MARTPTFKSLREAAEAGYHGKAVNIEGKGLQKVAFADKDYDRRMAERSARVGSRAPTESARPQARRRSVDEVARSASAAIDRAEGKPATRPQQNPRRVPGPNEGTATSVSTPRVTSGPIATPRVTSGPIDREVRRDPRDRAPTPTKVNRQDVIPQIVESFIDDATTPSQRSGAIKIAEEGARKRVPGRAIIMAIQNFLRGEGPTDPSVILREGRTSGMAKGGMAKKQGYNLGGTVKKGNTDRRKTGMFYDSKSPRGYK
jgi:hypothetical protein